MSESKGNGGKFFLGAALGAIAGAIAGIVMAPKSGKETREDIKNASDKAVKDAKEKGCNLFKKVKKDVEEGKEKIAKKDEKAEKAEKAEKKSEKKEDK